MEAALVVSAFMLGLAGSPHCAAMCGAACAGVLQGCGGPRAGAASWAFHVGRLSGYALVGGLLAAGVGALQGLGALGPALKPLWVLLHIAAMALGLWMAVTGRQPAWMTQWKSAPATPAGWQLYFASEPRSALDGWSPVPTPPVTVSGRNVVTLPPNGSKEFFRLVKP